MLSSRAPAKRQRGISSDVIVGSPATLTFEKIPRFARDDTLAPWRYGTFSARKRSTSGQTSSGRSAYVK